MLCNRLRLFDIGIWISRLLLTRTLWLGNKLQSRQETNTIREEEVAGEGKTLVTPGEQSTRGAELGTSRHYCTTHQREHRLTHWLTMQYIFFQVKVLIPALHPILFDNECNHIIPQPPALLQLDICLGLLSQQKSENWDTASMIIGPCLTWKWDREILYRFSTGLIVSEVCRKSCRQMNGGRGEGKIIACLLLSFISRVSVALKEFQDLNI